MVKILPLVSIVCTYNGPDQVGLVVRRDVDDVFFSLSFFLRDRIRRDRITSVLQEITCKILHVHFVAGCVTGQYNAIG